MRNQSQQRESGSSTNDNIEATYVDNANMNDDKERKTNPPRITAAPQPLH